MKRIYDLVVQEHLKSYNQMLFLSGPRQVGKTTLAENIRKWHKHCFYYNWDLFDDKEKILAGQGKIAELAHINTAKQTETVMVFDEIHKYSQWKTFIKGFFDLYKNKCKIVVTGSSSLNAYNRGGDSMMGRYFQYNIFPLTVGELTKRDTIMSSEKYPPEKISQKQFDRLWKYGGFPEPFLTAEDSFSLRWNKLRDMQLFKEDIRSLSNIQEIDQLELLAKFLKLQVGQLINRSELAKKIRVSTSTISRWINTLQMFYHCFEVKPWSRNIKRTLVKEPKLYLYDWSLLSDHGARAENFVALHLYKFVSFHNDLGHGTYGLYFLRDKDQNEVDFLVVKNEQPWFLVDVKSSSSNSISKALHSYQEQLKTQHAFQVVFDLPYVDKDCFKYNDPTIVPASTLLSQFI